MNLWLVGKLINYKRQAWQFQGIFDSEEKAAAACRTKKYFVGPVTLNKELPDKRIEWPGAYYPLL
jgi:hypothetical protein